VAIAVLQRPSGVTVAEASAFQEAWITTRAPGVPFPQTGTVLLCWTTMLSVKSGAMRNDDPPEKAIWHMKTHSAITFVRYIEGLMFLN
jgi:hypothetical protein